MKACIALHDFSVVNNRLDLLILLKNYFKDFKISLFIVATDHHEDWGPSLERNDFLDKIRDNLDWIQLIPHALCHNGSEVQNIKEDEFREYLNNIQQALQVDRLPYEKGFVAPHWRWNDNVVKVLDELGWWGAVDRDKVMPHTQKFYKYNYLLNEDFPIEDNLKLHGHVYGTKNSIGRCINNVLRLPRDTEFKFVTDYLEDL